MKSNKLMTKQAPLIAAFLLFIGSCIIACGGSTHNNNEAEKEVEQTSWSLYGVTIKKLITDYSKHLLGLPQKIH